MSNIEDNVKQSIDGLIFALRSKNITELSATKLLLLINKKFRLQLDINALIDILSDNGSVSEVNDDKIILGPKEESSDSNETNDDIHDKAVEQAGKDMTSSIGESIDKLRGTKLSKQIKLDESMEDYYLIKSALKNKEDLIIENIEIKNDKASSIIECKIGTKPLYVKIPIKNIF